MIDSAEAFVALRSSSDPAEYLRAAREEAPLHVWMRVVDDYPDYRRWAAHNKTVPLEVLDLLAGDEDASVRWTVAGKRKTPDCLLRRLAVDSDESVRMRVARHRNASAVTLRLLERDPWEAIRETVRARLAAG